MKTAFLQFNQRGITHFVATKAMSVEIADGLLFIEDAAVLLHGVNNLSAHYKDVLHGFFPHQQPRTLVFGQTVAAVFCGFKVPLYTFLVMNGCQHRVFAAGDQPAFPDFTNRDILRVIGDWNLLVL